jgi:hypothetical protein
MFENEGLGPGLAATLAKGLMGNFLFPGKIELFTCPPTEILEDWALCNGDLFALTSDKGIALNGLSSAMKTALGIAINGSNINVPNLFDSSGNGYFLRPVNGTTRAVGDKQGDASRNIKSPQSTKNTQIYTSTINGRNLAPFVYSTESGQTTSGYYIAVTAGSGYNIGYAGFDASLTGIPVATENRPINIGALPCIYLGDLTL